MQVLTIRNSDWTEWRIIQEVIMQELDECEVRGRLEISSTTTPLIVRHKVQLLTIIIVSLKNFKIGKAFENFV